MRTIFKKGDVVERVKGTCVNTWSEMKKGNLYTVTSYHEASDTIFLDGCRSDYAGENFKIVNKSEPLFEHERGTNETRT